MKFLASILFFCFLLLGIGSYKGDATSYDGIVELPQTSDNKDQVDLGAPVKINLTIKEKKGNVLEFDSNVSIIKKVKKLFGSTSPFIKVTNLDNNEVVYSDFDNIKGTNKQEVKMQQQYSSVKSIKLDPGKYEIYYEYEMRIKTSTKDDPFRVGKSGALPIVIK
ncbi:hypothetical protein [Metabacillus halosaccharovorans]|uniref:hypothetical protein n=1 Tax=Metabacillus halosaccharovorans TaxID=930124 RepID=UPI000C810780|nr:hypothetical protein [Metabacillus halosaccharovorans]MCM3444192.1 hypothetical protein [Metabacillus halosaccharovorans]PMC36407.1 hypothetical protein CJ195_16600 [Bacillus sp. UMB0899]